MTEVTDPDLIKRLEKQRLRDQPRLEGKEGAITDPELIKRLDAARQAGAFDPAGSVKALGTGVVRGIGPTLGFPLDVGEKIAEGAANILPSTTITKEAAKFGAGVKKPAKSAAQEINEALEGFTGPLHTAQNPIERYLETIGTYVPGSALGAAWGQGPARALVRGAIYPGIMSEGASDTAKHYGASKEDQELARVIAALAAPTLGQRQGTTMGLTPNQAMMRENLIQVANGNKKAWPTAGQSLQDPGRMAEEARVFPDKNIEQRKAVVDAAMSLAGKRSPEGLTSTNNLTHPGPGWFEERQAALLPGLQAGDPTAKAQWARMEALGRASKQGQVPFPDFEAISQGAAKNANPKALRSGKIDLYNLAEAAKTGMPPLPPPERDWSMKNIIRHFSPLATLGGMGAGAYYGHHLLPEMMPFLPHMIAGSVGGMIGGGAHLAGRSATRGIRMGELGGRYAMSPYNPYDIRDALMRLGQAAEHDQTRPEDAR